MDDNQPKSKCFVYSRRSQDREDRQYNSLEKQERNTRQVVKDNGLTPIFLPPEERSAYKPGRPIFNDMVQRIKDQKVRYIAVWHHSRLSRNAFDAGQIIQLMDDGDLLAIYTPGKTFRNTADDKAFLGFNLTSAKKNNDDLSDQVRDSFVEKRNHGEYPGPAPLGYINSILGPKTRNITPDPEKATKVIECFKFASMGIYTLDDVWKYAVNIGLKSRKGNNISKQSLVDMLQRRVYTGVFKYGGDEWHQGTYERLISIDLYEKVQIAMGWKRASTKLPATTSGRNYLYKGLFLCRTCRFNITAYTKIKKLASGQDKEYVFYTCTKKNKKIKCKEPQLSDKLLETEILTNMQGYEISEADGKECSYWLEQHYSEFIKERSRYKPLWLKDLRQAKSALDVLDGKLESGTISDERYKQRAAKHEFDIARTTQLLKAAGMDADRWLELSKETFSGVVNLGEVFQEANNQEKRQLMMFLGSNWYLCNKKVVLIPKKPLNLLSVSDRNPNWRSIKA
jgi:site-specific DNA recombinase